MFKECFLTRGTCFLIPATLPVRGKVQFWARAEHLSCARQGAQTTFYIFLVLIK